MPQSDYSVNITVKTTDKTSAPAKKASRGLANLASAAKALAGAMVVRQVAKYAVELTKLGIQSKAAEQRFTAFAGGVDRASMFLKAFNEGSLGTVDRMTAMTSASKLLQMGLVTTGDEMSQIAAMATRLGDQTIGTEERMSSFAAMLANQSIPRLDNFGISSGRVRQRIDELLKSGQALSREEAFKMAVIEEGSKALEVLGDTTDTVAHKKVVLQAALSDVKTGIGEVAVEALDAVGPVDGFAAGLRTIPELLRGVVQTFGMSEAEMRAWAAQTVEATEITRYAQYAIEDEEEAASSAIVVIDEFSDVALRSEEAQDRAARAAERLEEGLRLQAVAAMETAEAHLGMAMRYADFEQDQTDAAQSFADQREQIEEKHQEALAKIAKKGQGWRKQVDEEGLRLEVRIAQGRLEELLGRQAKFNDETSDLDRARTEQSIRNLQGQIAEKTGILQVAHDGYVAMKGQNTDNLLAEEDRQYQESLLKLEESQTQQELAQRESLGRMILAHFNAWAEMNLAADGFTTEEAQFVTDMRNEISTEYGLITDNAVQKMLEQEKRWAATMATMKGSAAGFFDYFKQQFNALPSEKVIRIRTELATPQTAEGRMGGETLQHGTAFAGGGMSLVGERGPELMSVPRGAQVYPTDQSRHMTNNYNLTVNSSATAGHIGDEFALMESLAA